MIRMMAVKAMDGGGRRDGDYMIVMTILSGFENLRNQFFILWVELGPFRKIIILEQIFSFFSRSKFIHDKIQPQV